VWVHLGRGRGFRISSPCTNARVYRFGLLPCVVTSGNEPSAWPGTPALAGKAERLRYVSGTHPAFRISPTPRGNSRGMYLLLPLIQQKMVDILYKILYDLSRSFLNFWKIRRVGIGEQMDEGKRSGCIPSDQQGPYLQVGARGENTCLEDRQPMAI